MDFLHSSSTGKWMFFLLKPDSGFYLELDKRELSTFQIKASPNILPTKSKDCGHNLNSCMDLVCLSTTPCVTLVTNTALLGIVTNLGGETNMRGVVTNMMDCDLHEDL